MKKASLNPVSIDEYQVWQLFMTQTTWYQKHCHIGLFYQWLKSVMLSNHVRSKDWCANTCNFHFRSDCTTMAINCLSLTLICHAHYTHTSLAPVKNLWNNSSHSIMTLFLPMYPQILNGRVILMEYFWQAHTYIFYI